MKKVKKLIRYIIFKLEYLLPRKFLKHYIKPYLVQKKKAPYNAKEYFESWHRSTFDQEFSARVTISPDYYALFSKFHYNAVENSIIKYLVRHEPVEKAKILDIGSGSGYWIDFYAEILDIKSITGVEISETGVNALKNKYKDIKNVKILAGDISKTDFDLNETFDLINAIGVMFHIVEDNAWEAAVRNLNKHLNPNGVVIVGGQFGAITRNVQFHDKDRFNNWEEYTDSTSKVVLVNKRIRSLRHWKRCAKKNGLRISARIRTDRDRKIGTPENNVLILVKQ